VVHEHLAFVKERTGCNSMPLGATPVCPWMKSKKPTPVMVAVPRRGSNEEDDGKPQALARVARGRPFLPS
jgi:hypothetical protein